jgi:hypothetical protein
MDVRAFAEMTHDWPSDRRRIDHSGHQDDRMAAFLDHQDRLLQVLHPEGTTPSRRPKSRL